MWILDNHVMYCMPLKIEQEKVLFSFNELVFLCEN